MKTFLKLVLVSLFITLTYLGYFIFIGIPKTQARTLYNKALFEIHNNSKELAKEELKKALTYWKEKYIEDTYNSL